MTSSYIPYRTKTQEILELSCPYDHASQSNRKRLLFVCSAGLLRSPTAAAVATAMGYNARSCGTGNYALIQLSANLIYWAHHIYFMNPENRYVANSIFKDKQDILHLLNTKSISLNIEDKYNYMDPELTSMLHKILGEERNN